MTTLQEAWDEAVRIPQSTKLDDSVIYKGVKIVSNEDGIKIYSTESDFYRDITDSFLVGDFKNSMRLFLSRKYLRLLGLVERRIKKEIIGKRNHKKYNYLKNARTNLIEKYNEINSKKITG